MGRGALWIVTLVACVGCERRLEWTVVYDEAPNARVYLYARSGECAGAGPIAWERDYAPGDATEVPDGLDGAHAIGGVVYDGATCEVIGCGCDERRFPIDRELVTQLRADASCPATAPVECTPSDAGLRDAGAPDAAPTDAGPPEVSCRVPECRLAADPVCPEGAYSHEGGCAQRVYGWSPSICADTAGTPTEIAPCGSLDALTRSIDAFSATGGELRLGDCTYSPMGGESELLVRARPSRALVISGVRDGMTRIEGLVRLVGARNIVLSDVEIAVDDPEPALQLETSTTSVPTSDVVVARATITNQAGIGIRLLGAEDVTLRDVVVESNAAGLGLIPAAPGQVARRVAIVNTQFVHINAPSDATGVVFFSPEDVEMSGCSISGYADGWALIRAAQRTVFDRLTVTGCAPASLDPSAGERSVVVVQRSVFSSSEDPVLTIGQADSQLSYRDNRRAGVDDLALPGGASLVEQCGASPVVVNGTALITTPCGSPCVTFPPP